MRLSLTRSVRFFALHRFYRPEWSAEENRAAFGTLADEPGHGHDYECAVSVSAPFDERSGMVIDLATLDRILDDEIVRPLADRHLNVAVPEFASGATLPTCEALAALLFRRVAARLPAGVTLDRVRVAEDPSLYADCTG